MISQIPLANDNYPNQCLYDAAKSNLPLLFNKYTALEITDIVLFLQTK